MIRPAVLATFIGLVAPAPAMAEIVYVGDAFVQAVTPKCRNVIAAGDYARLIYRPAIPGFGNGADSYLAYVPGRASYAMTVPNNTFQARVNYAGQSVGSTLNVQTKTGGVLDWQQDPQQPDLSGRSMTVTASIANFWTITGCTVTFQTNLLRVKSNVGENLN